MEFGEDSSPALAFEKDAFQLTVEDVYDISYVIGRDLLKISNTGEEVSDLQFRIVRVLEMFETLVNKYNLSLEELKMERDNLKSELDRMMKEGSVPGQNRVSVSSRSSVSSSCELVSVTFSCLPSVATGRTKSAGGGPDGSQQTALHHAGAEGGLAGEEPAEGPAHGGPGRTPAV